MSRKTILASVSLSCLVLAPSFSLAQEGGLEAFGGEAQRVSTSIAYFAQPSENEFVSAGGVAINYGQPEWKAEYEEQFDELTKGKRWRFGNNFWTTLDTNLPLTIAGTEVAPGYYYLVLERSNEDQWSLVLLDPKPIQAKKLDASGAEDTSGGVSAPLTPAESAEPAVKLTVKLVRNEENIKKATLEIQWGTRKLTAPIEVGVEIPASE
jgi:hypothetical protein